MANVFFLMVAWKPPHLRWRNWPVPLIYERPSWFGLKDMVDYACMEAHLQHQEHPTVFRADLETAPYRERPKFSHVMRVQMQQAPERFPELQRETSSRMLLIRLWGELNVEFATVKVTRYQFDDSMADLRDDFFMEQGKSTIPKAESFHLIPHSAETFDVLKTPRVTTLLPDEALELYGRVEFHPIRRKIEGVASLEDVDLYGWPD